MVLTAQRSHRRHDLKRRKAPKENKRPSKRGFIRPCGAFLLRGKKSKKGRYQEEKERPAVGQRKRRKSFQGSEEEEEEEQSLDVADE